MKKNIAVIYGGFSSEYEISIKSGKNIASVLDKNKFEVFEVLIKKDAWKVFDKYEINKADFSFSVGNKKIKFDAVVIIIHGTPGENGILQSYFDLIGLPYIGCNNLASALTFNKFYCNGYLRSLGFNIAKSILIRKNEKNYDEIFKHIKLPFFVKPNAGGSSFGTTKVKRKEDLLNALNKAFKESDEVMVETFIKGTELTCAVLKYKGKIKALTPVEIVSKNEFFDFEAKYNPSLNQEIIPARVDKNILEKVKQTSEKIYESLNCSGIVRIDYILSDEDNKLYFLELNSIPGMTAESIVPKIIKYDKLDLTAILTSMIEEKINL